MTTPVKLVRCSPPIHVPGIPRLDSPPKFDPPALYINLLLTFLTFFFFVRPITLSSCPLQYRRPHSFLRRTILVLGIFLLPLSFSIASTMSLTRVPLPSFALVLTSDVVFLPTHPSVIKRGFDPLQTVHPAASAEHHSVWVIFRPMV